MLIKIKRLSLLLIAITLLINQNKEVKSQANFQEVAEQVTVTIFSPSPTQRRKKVIRGSGAIINKTDKTYQVITNAHVVKTDEDYLIRVIKGKKEKYYSAQIVKKELTQDLALLEFVSSKIYPVAELGNSNDLSLSDTIYVYGWVSEGETASREVAPAKLNQFTSEVLKYTSQTHGGMSGGPVFNKDGKLIGIHKGVGQGISIEIVKQFLSTEIDPNSPGCNVAIIGLCQP